MRDTVVEAFLTRWGHTFTYVNTVPLDRVRVTDAARANIRPIGLDDDKVMEYALAMEGGAEFPALVLYGADGAYGVLTGLHRLEAGKLAKVTTTDAYVLPLDAKRDERTIEMLQRVLNTVNGLAPSKAERVMHGIRLIARGYSQTDVARMLNLHHSVLSNKLAVERATVRAQAAGLKPVNLTETVLVQLDRLKNPEVFAQAIRLALEARLTAEQAIDLSREIRQQDCDADALKVLDSWRARLQGTVMETAKGQFAGPVSHARRAGVYFERFQRFLRQQEFSQLTRHELGVWLKAIKAMQAKLAALQRRLEDALKAKRTAA